MNKSVPKQLLDYLRANPDMQFPSGSLQRMQWKNQNGTLATPRTVVRRLQDLAKEGLIHNHAESNKPAIYSANKAKIPVKPIYEEVRLPNGEYVRMPHIHSGVVSEA